MLLMPNFDVSAKGVKEIGLEVVWGKLGPGMVFGGGRLRDIGGWFSCGVARRGGGLVAVFRGYFASAGRIFIFPGGLGAGLSGEV